MTKVLAFLAAITSSILANELSAYLPAIGRWSVRFASTWKPVWERQDFLDELMDQLDCYEADGLRLTCALQGLSQMAKEIPTLVVLLLTRRRFGSGEGRVLLSLFVSVPTFIALVGGMPVISAALISVTIGVLVQGKHRGRPARQKRRSLLRVR